MTDLAKILAMDEADLTVLSALSQDAVLKGSDIDYSAKAGKLILQMNRYVWELPGARRWLFPTKERRLSVLHFDRVTKVRSKGIDAATEETILSLLAIGFGPSDVDDDPSGTITLTFSGSATLEADVECIEARLTDLGAAWSASSRPRHAGGEDL